MKPSARVIKPAKGKGRWVSDEAGNGVWEPDDPVADPQREVSCHDKDVASVKILNSQVNDVLKVIDQIAKDFETLALDYLRRYLVIRPDLAPDLGRGILDLVGAGPALEV